MRISDWSSDVCSSDLVDETRRATDQRAARKHQLGHRLPAAIVDRPCAVRHALAAFEQFADRRVCLPALHLLEGREIRIAVIEPGRSEERRVGKVGVRTLRSRWSPYLYKKKPSIQKLSSRQ